jgi:hypothetical protein
VAAVISGVPGNSFSQLTDGGFHACALDAAGAEVTLSDDVLDQIDAIIPPGTGVGQLQMGYVPSALTVPHLRRRPPGEITAA